MGSSSSRDSKDPLSSSLWEAAREGAEEDPYGGGEFGQAPYAVAQTPPRLAASPMLFPSPLRAAATDNNGGFVDSMLLLSSPLSPMRRRGRLSPSAASAAASAAGHGGGSAEGTSSAVQATFNCINLLLGIGVLSLPYALRCGGFGFGLGLLLFLTVLTNYTARLLGRCLLLGNGSIKTYSDIGEAAFGKLGRGIVSFTFFAELLAACGMYMIVCVDNLALLLPNVPHIYLVAGFTLLVLPSTWTTRLTILSYFSILGVASSIFLLIVLVFRGIDSGSLRSPAPTTIAPPAMDQWPIAIGLIMVGFAGHAAFPSVHGSLRDKKKYGCVLNSAYVVVVAVNVTLAVCGYLMFGDATKEEVTMNLSSLKHGSAVGDWLSKAAVFMIIVNPITKFALTLNPVALTTEALVLSCGRALCEGRIPREGGDKGAAGVAKLQSERLSEADGLLRRYGKSHPLLRRCGCCCASGVGVGFLHCSPGCVGMTLFRIVTRTGLTGLAVLLAVTVPHFARVVSFVGALFSFAVSGAFPSLFFLKLMPEAHPCEKALNVLIVALSIVCTIAGVYGSIWSPNP